MHVRCGSAYNYLSKSTYIPNWRLPICQRIEMFVVSLPLAGLEYAITLRDELCFPPCSAGGCVVQCSASK